MFVPEFNLGAMENPGVVTLNEDHFIFRTAVTEAARVFAIIDAVSVALISIDFATIFVSKSVPAP